MFKKLAEMSTLKKALLAGAGVATVAAGAVVATKTGVTKKVAEGLRDLGVPIPEGEEAEVQTVSYADKKENQLSTGLALEQAFIDRFYQNVEVTGAYILDRDDSGDISVGDHKVVELLHRGEPKTHIFELKSPVEWKRVKVIE